jgi:GT2 family glycosyltransferase
MADVEVVVPTISEDVHTLSSIPEDVTVHVRRDPTLNEARNRGVEAATTDRIVIMDDDISFPEEIFWKLVEGIEREKLIGIEDWDFGLVAGRVMAFHRADWQAVGGFDERLGSHMGDTDFALKYEARGYEIERLPRSTFEHVDHERSITTWDRLWRSVYLLGKHPRAAPRLIRGLVFS